jgi:poly(A) polymerase
MLWHDVLDRWNKLRAGGEPAFPALQQAIDAAFDARIGDISGRGKLAADMREIWMMQPRFERRVGNAVATLVEQPRFRAGFDFLRLRADAGEIDGELAEWWEDYSLGSDEERVALMDVARERDHARRGSGASARGGQITGEGSGERAPDSGGADPARKKRRRRRKPAGGGGAGEAGPAAPAAE